MVQNKVCKGSGVYVNGIAMTIVATTLVIIRRNGFRAISLITGESVSHRGTVVVLSDNCVIIKGGKPVHVLNGEFWRNGNYVEGERYTIHNGEIRKVSALHLLTGGSMMKINTSVAFVEYWSDNAGQPQDKDNGEFWSWTVMKKGDKKFIGYHEFN